MNSKIKKTSKSITKSKKKVPAKLHYIPTAAAIAGIVGLGINRLIKKSSFGPRRTSEITMEPVNEEKKIAFYTSLDLDKDLKSIQKALTKEQEANKKLVEHINKCNKEVIRLQGLVSQKSSLRKEALLRSTIKKLQKNKQN